jgi:hypothetical protein
MANDYQGSIAQQFVTFSTTQTITSVVGSNFYTVGVYVGSGADATAYFVGTPPAIGAALIVNQSNFATLTQGTLLTDLTLFFASNSLSQVYLVVYDSTVSTFGGIAVQFPVFKQFFYFTVAIASGVQSVQNSLGIVLSTQCLTDTLLTKACVGTNDPLCASLTQVGDITSQWGVTYAVAGLRPWMVYHATANGVMAQLGLTLGSINATGTPVGNKTSYIATSNITPSGAAGANPDATTVTNLVAKNVGFFLTVGNSTGQVALKGQNDIRANSVAANWLVQYVDYVAGVSTATYLTNTNAFKNNDTYQGILSILSAVLTPFGPAGLQRLSNLLITKASFSSLPATAGNTITIPNAWSAVFNSNVEVVTVQGNLTISA